ncbi:MAG: TRAP transporter small permease [Dehalococcoidia bacterium]|nr:TRAP transporter small permease [Dehalococcoidia bacterium]
MGKGGDLKGTRAGQAGWSRRIVTLAGWLAMGSLLLIMLLTVADVLMRYLFVKPITGAVDVSTFLLVFLITMGIAYTQAQGRHIGVEVFVQRLSSRSQRRLKAFFLLVGLALFALMTWAAARSTVESWQQREFWFSAIRFPAWPIKASLFVGFLLLWFELLRELRALRETKQR